MDPSTPRPTGAELEILRILWDRGAATVKQIQSALSAGSGVSGASVLKLLQIMEGKGLVQRDASARAHVFQATCSEDRVQDQLTTHLVDRAFGGSAARLAMRALATRPSSPEELAEIEALLERFRSQDGEGGAE
ncbi:transcriptional regulator [Acidobacteria bacterium Mor1]|nr:transcriptional regulator [Acidobacteria bacterium Mor1]